MAYRYFFGWAAGLTMGVLAFAVLLKRPDGMPGYTAELFSHYGLTASLVMFASILISALGTHGRTAAVPMPDQRAGDTFAAKLRDIRTALSEPAFLIIFAASVFGAMAVGLGSTLLYYYRTYFWNLTGDQMSVLIASNFISVALAPVMAPAVARRFGKVGAAVAVSLGAILIGPAPIALRLVGLFPDNGDPLLMPILFVSSAVAAGLAIMSGIFTSSMIADVVEQSQIRTGKRNEGLFFSAVGLVVKSVSGLGLFMGGLLLDIAGFPKGAVVGPEAEGALRRLAMFEIPLTVTLYLIAIAFVARYPINRRVHQDNLDRLAERSGTVK